MADSNLTDPLFHDERDLQRLQELSREIAPNASQTDVAVELIRSRIIDLTLAPSSRIDERILIEVFQLGRTPAREAINRLVAEGFVSIQPQRGGTFVRSLDLEELGQLVVTYQVSESVSGQLCRLDDRDLLPDLVLIQKYYEESVNQRNFLEITRLNQIFHLRIHKAVKNYLLYDFAKRTQMHMRRFNMYVYKGEYLDEAYQADQFSRNVRHHREIIDHIRERDAEALAKILPIHAKEAQTRLVDIINRGFKNYSPENFDIQPPVTSK